MGGPRPMGQRASRQRSGEHGRVRSHHRRFRGQTVSPRGMAGGPYGVGRPPARDRCKGAGRSAQQDSRHPGDHPAGPRGPRLQGRPGRRRLRSPTGRHDCGDPRRTRRPPGHYCLTPVAGNRHDANSAGRRELQRRHFRRAHPGDSSSSPFIVRRGDDIALQLSARQGTHESDGRRPFVEAQA